MTSSNNPDDSFESSVPRNSNFVQPVTLSPEQTARANKAIDEWFLSTEERKGLLTVLLDAINTEAPTLLEEVAAVLHNKLLPEIPFKSTNRKPGNCEHFDLAQAAIDKIRALAPEKVKAVLADFEVECNATGLETAVIDTVLGEQ